ncbi:MAG: hypothetical protein ACK6D7_22755, partial [Acidobacteriota bacterium]
MALGVGAGAAYWYWQARQPEAPTATAVAIRTATVQKGKVERTLRLTGVTAALNYSSLIAPSLRGGRSSSGGGNLVSSGGGMAMMGGGRSGGSSSGGSSAGGSGGGAGGSGGGSFSGGMTAAGGSATGGQAVDTLASTSSGASRTAAPTTLRSARSASGRAAAPAAAPRAATSSRGSSSGGGSLGSTASMLVGSGGPGGGGSGGGRGGSEFMLQLQELAKSGAIVKKDEVVAEFDRQYMLQRLDDFQSTVTQSEADFRKQVAELEITRKNYEQQVLTAKNAVDKAELDVRTIPVRSAIESERLRLALEEAKANFKQLQEARRFLDVGERAQVRSAELELQATKLEFRRSQANADRMM